MRMKSLSALVICMTFLLACNQAPKNDVHTQKDTPQPAAATEDSILVGKDYHSYANPEEVLVKHISLDLNVNFEQKVLKGSVVLNYERVDEDAKQLVIDTRDIQIDAVSAYGQALTFAMADADPNLGAAVSIDLPDNNAPITIAYQTSPQASGVQWLTPAQTAGKKHPFLFTQAQAIHARSFIPLQDSPKVRVSYDAVIRTPKDLLAVMSASNDPDTERDGVYEFNMPQPIPSYLIALAVGNLEFQSMGERTGVYAEPSLLTSAAAEFEDTEDMLKLTEKRFGKYRWDRYDLLILPPSFPFGGMENPRLSFITPTVIAGDKSLVALIAHELAHSWSGNTVTNATWRDLWLNEGFTTYLTYRIMNMVFGDDRFNMEFVLGRQDLMDDIDGLATGDQILAIDLRGRDADDVFSNIPYEKGSLFLMEIEQKVGTEAFDQFLLAYFEDFAFQSITTDQFIAYLDKTLLKDHAATLSKARIEQWIFEPGIPEGAPVATSNAFVVVDESRTKWLAGEMPASDIDTSSWVFHQWMHFLNNMPAKLSQARLAELDAVFDFTQSKNNEIAHSWLHISINNWYEPAFPRLHDYLTSIGRNKLVKPLYAALSKTPEGKAMARKAFEQAKSGYHPLTVKANEGFVK